MKVQIIYPNGFITMIRSPKKKQRKWLKIAKQQFLKRYPKGEIIESHSGDYTFSAQYSK